jgi:hypothetical protein
MGRAGVPLVLTSVHVPPRAAYERSPIPFTYFTFSKDGKQLFAAVQNVTDKEAVETLRM